MAVAPSGLVTLETELCALAASRALLRARLDALQVEEAALASALAPAGAVANAAAPPNPAPAARAAGQWADGDPRWPAATRRLFAPALLLPPAPPLGPVGASNQARSHVKAAAKLPRDLPDQTLVEIVSGKAGADARAKVGGLRSGAWRPDEVDRWAAGLRLYGTEHWPRVARIVGTRTSHRCRSKWKPVDGYGGQGFPGVVAKTLPRLPKANEPLVRGKSRPLDYVDFAEVTRQEEAQAITAAEAEAEAEAETEAAAAEEDDAEGAAAAAAEPQSLMESLLMMDDDEDNEDDGDDDDDGDDGGGASADSDDEDDNAMDVDGNWGGGDGEDDDAMDADDKWGSEDDVDNHEDDEDNGAVVACSLQTVAVEVESGAGAFAPSPALEPTAAMVRQAAFEKLVMEYPSDDSSSGSDGGPV